MELTHVLEARRSIRKYEYKPVRREDIEQMIQAATLAPSWKNSQTARYHVVTSEAMLQEIKENCLPEFNRNNAQNAPVLIICSFVKTS